MFSSKLPNSNRGCEIRVGQKLVVKWEVKHAARVQPDWKRRLPGMREVVGIDMVVAEISRDLVVVSSSHVRLSIKILQTLPYSLTGRCAEYAMKSNVNSDAEQIPGLLAQLLVKYVVSDIPEVPMANAAGYFVLWLVASLQGSSSRWCSPILISI